VTIRHIAEPYRHRSECALNEKEQRQEAIVGTAQLWHKTHIRIGCESIILKSIGGRQD
jgi:hypothetical protein